MITSPKNKQVAAAARLKKRGLREQYRTFLAEGAQAAGEAVAAGAADRLFHVPGASGRVPAVVAEAGAAGVPVVAVSEAVMGHLTGTVTPQGIVAVARFVDVGLASAEPEGGLVPVLCSVRDPGNAGTILRSADASGAAAVVFSEGSVDVYNPKTVRASAGSLFHLPVVREVPAPDAVAELRSRGVRVLAAAADGRDSIYDVDLTGPTAVLFGNEAWGLPPAVRDLAEGSVRVPISGRAESLNLAAAAALVMFEAARQRSAGGRPDDVVALLSAAAHDVRLPLTALKGAAATLVARWDQLEDGRRADLARDLRLGAERATAMVTSLIDVARRRGGSMSAAPERLGEAARWVADLYALSADAPEMRVEGDAEVRAERERLRGLILLVSESVSWWGDGPVEVRIRPADGGADVEFARAGEGPTAAEIEAAVDPRSRYPRIPLILARRLAGLMGGAVEVAPGVARIRLSLRA
ncbi:MAG TPA: TrmH family RNA methyltransferase [Actinomycetota bacterium]|nr:TrmH family RNA methyltransferase [Actinomycetota bacterium]